MRASPRKLDESQVGGSVLHEDCLPRGDVSSGVDPIFEPERDSQVVNNLVECLALAFASVVGLTRHPRRDLPYVARGIGHAPLSIPVVHPQGVPHRVATKNPSLMAGLVVSDKRHRVSSFHQETIISAAEMLGAMGLHGSQDLRPWHVVRRISETEVRHYGELFEYVDDGCLLQCECAPSTYVRALKASVAESFEHA